MDQANVLIVGGGIVGCAIAEALSRRWHDVFLVEQYPKLGMATSTRNSGVVHSGIYYAKNSWKARHCVEGNRLTKEFCARHNVSCRTTGKLVVAKDASEEKELLALMKKGEGNGVEDLRIIDAAGIRAIEPHIKGHAALLVPSTGICSAEDLVDAFARLDEEQSETEAIEARCVINAAGLYSDEVALLLGPRPWRIYPMRGEYCEIRGPRAELVQNLVYPLPHHDSLYLGLHFTKTLTGTVLVGPTATYVEGKDNYERDRMTVSEFVPDAKTMLP